MNTEDYLLACLSEEAGEIIQEIGKCHRFGKQDSPPNSDQTNWDRLRVEVHQLIAVYEMICEDDGRRPLVMDRQLIVEKKVKVNHYMEYSASLGRLES